MAKVAKKKVDSPLMTEAALGRATLARQALLAREKSALRVIERVAGLQAQWPKPPFVGLWSRVEPFARDDLMRLVRARKVVRATMMRGTLHLLTAKDYLRFRPTMQPLLTKGMRAVLKGRAQDLDIDALVREARGFFLEKPRTFGEVRDFLMTLHPKSDERAMGYAVRMTLPLIQTPHDTSRPGAPGADWGYPADADFALAESWLGCVVGEESDAPDDLVLRYLEAFGPATVGDAQAWSGLQALAPVFERLRPKLATFRDERGRELFDAPSAPRPPEDTPAPARFLPEFDNLIVSREGARFVRTAHRKRVFLSALRVRATFLVGGVAAGTWSVGRKKAIATLLLEPFAPLAKKARGELEREGDALARFIEPEATSVEIAVAKG